MAAGVLLLWSAAPVAAGGPFTLANGYFELSGTDGMVTSLRLDQSGSGNYDANTVRSGGRFTYRVNGTVLQSAASTYTQTANQLVVANLPQGATVTYTMTGPNLTALIEFAGSKTTQFDWDMPFISAGYYDRATGQNSSPASSVDMPFESFWNPEGTNFAFYNIESLKDAVGEDRGAFFPMMMRGRATRDDSVQFNASFAVSTLEVASNQLRARVGPATATTNAVVVLGLSPKTYSYTMSGSPSPEFFVEPDIAIPQRNNPATTYPASNLLTELFQHTCHWWGPAGGIWSDWSMDPAAFMDNNYSDTMREFLLSWTITKDGYGEPWYAWSWGDRRGWPLGSGDTRNMNTNAIFISSLSRYVLWHGDRDLLLGGDPDFRVRIGYTDATTGLTVPDTAPLTPILAPRSRDFFNDKVPLGQTIVADKPFSSVGVFLADYGNNDSDLRLSLLNAPGGTVIATQFYNNIANVAWTDLSFATQPAGNYFVQISEYGGGDSAWYAYRNMGDEDIYPQGEGYRDGVVFGDMLTRARGLMGYYQGKLQASTNNYVVLANTGSSEQWGRDGDNTTNWYDLLPFGYEDIFTNLNFYEALEGMAELEELVGNDAQATVYRNQMAAFRVKFNERFWRNPVDNGIVRGRYIATIDKNGVERDYGFAGLNMWAVSLGLADPAQVTSIVNWMENGQSRNNVGAWNQDIYNRWVFAPRGQSLYNDGEWVAVVEPAWEKLQNGGAALHESGWDVVGRARHQSADAAWGRLKTILGRYAVPDRLSMATGFYGEEAQGGGSSGDVGWLYAEFPETSILGAAFFRGFFGEEPTADGLVLQPRIPGELTAIGARNIMYYGARFDLRATATHLTISVTDNPDDVSFSFNGGPRRSGTFEDVQVPLDANGQVLITPSGGGNIVWDFETDGNQEGWLAPIPPATMSNVNVSGGSLNYTITGNDPILQNGDGFNTLFQGAEHPWLYLRVRNQASNGAGQVLLVYLRGDDVYGIQSFNIANGPDWRDYALNPGAVGDWSSPMKLLRIDIPENTSGSGTVEIDRISLHPTQPPVTNTVWRFNTTGFAEGWSFAQHLTAPNVSAGRASCTITGLDPQIISPPSSLDPSNLRFLVLRSGSTSPGTQARVYWETAAAPGFDQSRSATLPIFPGSLSIVPTVVDLAGATGLTGEVTRLRIDPVDTGGSGAGALLIDEIAFYSAAPALGLTLQLSAPSFTYGPIFAGTTATQNLTITNAGASSPLVVWTASLQGTDANQFSFTGPNRPFTVGTGKILNVTYQPMAAGSHSATLVLTSNDPQSLTRTFNLSGTATSPASFEGLKVY